MWQRTIMMAKEGKLKLSKRQQKRDKTPSTGFD